jgi:hypothetical protein
MAEGQIGNTPSVYEEFRQRNLHAIAGQILLAKVPKNSIVFCDETGGFNNSPLNYIEFLRTWQVFSLNAFSTEQRNRNQIGRLFNGGGGGGGRRGPGQNGAIDPQADLQVSPRQPAQIEHLASLYDGKTADQLLKEQFQVVDDALQNGHGVFVVASPSRAKGFAREFDTHKYVVATLAGWSDVGPVGDDADITDPAAAQGGARRRMFGGPGMGARGGGGAGRYNPNEVSVFDLLEIKLRDPAH